VFNVLHAVVLRPLPYDNPDRLVRIHHVSGAEDTYLPGLALIENRARSRTVDIAAMYIYSVEGVDLTDRGQPERVQSLQVSADYFRVLRVTPLAGRVFERADEVRDARVAVVSERIWRNYLGGAPDVAGRSLTLNGIGYRVTAVVPDAFRDPIMPDVEIWTALNMQRGGPNSWDNHYLSAIGRLKDGATIGAAQAELAAIATRIQANLRGNGSVPRSARVAPLQEDTLGGATKLLWLLFGAVVLLLVIACVNIAGLVLARSAAREPELAVRAALGCSRWRLMRQLIVESVLLSIAGGIVGVLLAVALTQTLLAQTPETIAHIEIGSAPTLAAAFGLGVALVAGLTFGFATAAPFGRPDLEGVLRESSRGASAGRRQLRFRNVLVIAQVALALVLVIGAALLFRSFQRLSSVSLGIQPENVLTFQVHLPAGRYAEAQRRADFHLELQRRIAALPDVKAVGAVSRLPVTGLYHVWGTQRLDRGPDAPFVPANQRVIEGDYFQALGIPLLRGRTFAPEDRGRNPRQVVVSQELAHQLFPSEDPIGHRVRAGGSAAEIIGVVGDSSLGARTPARPMIYHSHNQYAANRLWALTQVVAARRLTPALLDAIRRELAAIDPALVLHQPTPLSDVIAGGLALDRFATLGVGVYALLAVSLAAVGIYGVLSYAVSRRRRELGIRLALGAPANSIRSLVVRDGGRLAAIGVVLGLAAAALTTRVLGSMLFEVSVMDPWVFGLAAAALAAVALAASWIPARTAAKVDPLHSLRADG
jgi:predicted permease